MRNNESAEDIYNSLPVDLFTNDFDEYETDSFGSELDNFTSEIESDIDYDQKASSEPDILADIKTENTQEEIENVSDKLERLNLETKNSELMKTGTESQKLNLPPVEDDNSIMWIRCVRCGKKNEIDCNFCGKCGLQIHKTVSIVERETEEELSPEVSRNIKYHYKRPVFCFGPRGNCFASFSSPSKSVRNVSKFQLSSLQEFRTCLDKMKNGKIFTENLSSVWNENELKDREWVQRDSILKDIAAMVSSARLFLLDEVLKNNLREYFASISPKDLGSIKMLATQDSVTYLRGEIDQIFHLLVIGKTMEACELCIKFNYWDHALIIAKTLDVSFYESVMNRFLDSRFDNGHPLRILYLIMTNNENYALEEIRNMISNQNMPMFVQDIWTILVNFLLRANHESLVISKIFEDIAKCLFDRELFENSLVCFIVSVLAGSKTPNSGVLGNIDYLIVWFMANNLAENINFSSIHILNVFVKNIESLNSKTIMWRCQFIRLLYSQFMHDFGIFDVKSLNWLNDALEYSKKLTECGYPTFLVEECAILEARNLVKIEKKLSTPNLNNSAIQQSTAIPNYASDNSLININTNTSAKSSLSDIYALESKADSYLPPFLNIESSSDPAALYSPLVNDDLISSHTPLSPINPIQSDNMKNDAPEIMQSSISSNTSQNLTDKSDKGNVFVKLKNWFPTGKSTATNHQQENQNQKQITKAKMGKPNSFRFDEKLKKWVDDNDPTTFEQAPKLPPPSVGTSSFSPAVGQMPPGGLNLNFRAKKGKVKYFDPLNPEGPSSSQLQPSAPSFD